MIKRILLCVLLLAAPLSAQQGPIAGTTVQTTDTSANSVLVGCVVGSTTCTGGIKAGPITASTGVFTGAISAAAATFSGLFNATLLGTHQFVAGGNAENALFVANTNSGASASAALYVGNNTSTSIGGLIAYSSGFGSSGPVAPNRTQLFNSGAGGLSIAATNAAGVIGFFTGGSAQRWGITAAGDLTFGSTGNITQASSTPTISGFGTSSSVSGTGSFFRVFTGSTSTTGGVITFGRTFGNAPICVATPESSGISAFYVQIITTTAVTVNYAAGTSLTFAMHCVGY